MAKVFVEKHRRTIRLRRHHYADWGSYFVTLKTENNRHLFGFIQSDRMVLNDFGRIVEKEWKKTAQIRPDVEIDDYIIMPDHFHGIIIIDPSRRGDLRSPIGIPNAPPNGISNCIPNAPPNDIRDIPASDIRDVSPINRFTPDIPLLPGFRFTPTGGIIKPQSASLAAILSGFKSAVTRQINQVRKTNVPQVWQRNYYERIIRDSGEFYNVRQYIRNNPANWGK